MDGVVLLADPETRAWKFAKKIQDYILSQKEDFVPLRELSLTQFRSGEIHPYVPENMRRKEVYFIQDSTKDPQYWLTELIFTKDLLLRASAEELTFVLPNLLYSRQDRKDKPRVSIHARAVADVISPGLSRVITMDLHADQIQGFYPQTCPLDSLHSFPTTAKYILEHPPCELEKLVVVSPDMGGIKRARNLARKLGTNKIAMISKERSKPGEIGEMYFLGDVEKKNVLIVDDIIDSGGTLCEAAKLLKERGAEEAYCYGTHGIFSKGTEELNSVFKRIMVSNTHYRENNELPGVEVIDLSPVFAEAIYRAHKGESISELF